MNGFEVLYCRSPAQIKNILPHSDIACASALASRDVCETVFDADALTQLRAARRGGLKHSELLLPVFVSADANSPSLAASGMRALRAKRARAAGLRVELDDFAGFKGLSLPGGTRDDMTAQVDLEVSLLEEVWLSAAHEPRLADDLCTGCHACASSTSVLLMYPRSM